MRLSDDDLIADRYRIVGVADTDADGTLYDAVDERFQRRVAVQVLPSDDAPTPEGQVLDGGVHDGQRFVVLAVLDDSVVDAIDEDATAAIPVMAATTLNPAVTEHEVVVAGGSPTGRSFAPVAAAILVAVVLFGAIALALNGKDEDAGDAPAADSTTTQPTTATTRRPQVTTERTTPAPTEPPVTEPPVTEPPTTEVKIPPVTDPPSTDAPVDDADSDTTAPGG